MLFYPLMPDRACRTDLVFIRACDPSTPEPEGTMGSSDGAHAQSRRVLMLVPSLAMTSSCRSSFFGGAIDMLDSMEVDRPE